MRNIKEFKNFVNELYSSLPKVGDEDLDQRFQYDYDRVLKIVNSCTHMEQLTTTGRSYIEHFNKKYSKIIDDLVDDNNKEEFLNKMQEINSLFHDKLDDLA